MTFPATVGAKALAMSPTGIYAIITNAGLVLFDRAAGQQVCLTERFPGAASYVALAAGANGSLYVVSGNRSASGSSVVGGSLTRYDVDGGCPASTDPGTAIESNGDVVLVAADDTSVYWITTAGAVLQAALLDTKARALGAADTTPTAMALDETHVYVAAGSAIYRFDKAP